MSKTTLLIGGLIINIMLGCAPAKKFDFRSAYKFKYIKHDQKDRGEEIPQPLLLVTTDQKTIITRIRPVNPRGLMKKGPHINSAAGNIFIRPSRQIEKKIVPVKDPPLQESREKKPAEVDSRPEMIKSKDIGETGKVQGREAWRDTPPEFKGFIFTAIGFGVVLAGILIGTPEILSLSLVILGFGIVGFGFMKMLGVF